MKELDVIKLKLFIEEFKKEVDPYDVVECGMDSFDPYTYIDDSKMKEHYPTLHKTMKELQVDYDYEVQEFETEWLYEIK